MPRVTSLPTSGSSRRPPWDSTTSGYESRPHPPSPRGWPAVNPRVGAGADRGPRLAFSVLTMRPSYNAPEAPTHLRAGDLPPGLLDDVDPLTSAARPGSYHSTSAMKTNRRSEPAPLPAVPRYPDEHLAYPDPEHSLVSQSRSRSAFAAAPRVRTEPGSIITPPARSPRSTPRSGTAVPEPGSIITPPARSPRSTPRSGTAAPRPADAHPAAGSGRVGRPGDPSPEGRLGRPGRTTGPAGCLGRPGCPPGTRPAGRAAGPSRYRSPGDPHAARARGTDLWIHSPPRAAGRSRRRRPRAARCARRDDVVLVVLDHLSQPGWHVDARCRRRDPA